jgi:hypothetical protein
MNHLYSKNYFLESGKIVRIKLTIDRETRHFTVASEEATAMDDGVPSCWVSFPKTQPSSNSKNRHNYMTEEGAELEFSYRVKQAKLQQEG